MRGLLVALLALLGVLTAGCGQKGDPEDGRPRGAAPTEEADPTAGVAELDHPTDATDDPVGAASRVRPPHATEKTRPLVFIDPGHGGLNGGAEGPSGAQEKTLVLSVSEHLRQALLDTGLVDVQLARETDQDLDLVRRPRMANAAGADVFVSLHMNWAESTQATGVETYYLDTATDEAAERLAWRENLNSEDMPTDLENILSDLRLAGNVEASRALALRVHQELVDGLDEFYGDGEVRDRGLRTALFAVLVRAEMPAVLVEVCFLSNAEEGQRARTRAFQEQAAQAMSDGIIGFLRDQGQLPPPDPLAGGGAAAEARP